MKLKYFAITIIAAIVMIAGFMTFTKKPVEAPQGYEKVNVTSPRTGDRWGNAFVHVIRWEYSIPENVTIALCSPMGCEILASEIPNTGEYQWGVSAASGEGYTIEVYPAGGRERVGRSEVFTIIQVK